METLLLVVVLVGLGVGAWSVFFRKTEVSTSAPTRGGGDITSSPTLPSDGSVVPPSSGENAK